MTTHPSTHIKHNHTRSTSYNPSVGPRVLASLVISAVPRRYAWYWRRGELTVHCLRESASHAALALRARSRKLIKPPVIVNRIAVLPADWLVNQPNNLFLVMRRNWNFGNVHNALKCGFNNPKQSNNTDIFYYETFLVLSIQYCTTVNGGIIFRKRSCNYNFFF